MTTADTKFRSLALRLINKSGKTVIYTHRTEGEGVYDSDTESVVFPENSFSVKAFLYAPNTKDLERGIIAGEEVALIAAAAIDFEPDPVDRIEFGGKSYTVRPVWKVWSGELVALWYVGVKKV